ncbi:MAG: hypothetical protein ACHQQR_11385, partial [Gemmatimonadales bacterium]
YQVIRIGSREGKETQEKAYLPDPADGLDRGEWPIAHLQGIDTLRPFGPGKWMVRFMGKRQGKRAQVGTSPHIVLRAAGEGKNGAAHASSPEALLAGLFERLDARMEARLHEREAVLRETFQAAAKDKETFFERMLEQERQYNERRIALERSDRDSGEASAELVDIKTKLAVLEDREKHGRAAPKDDEEDDEKGGGFYPYFATIADFAKSEQGAQVLGGLLEFLKGAAEAAARAAAARAPAGASPTVEPTR